MKEGWDRADSSERKCASASVLVDFVFQVVLPVADTQHVWSVHKAPWSAAAGHQWQGHEWLAVRLQPSPGRHNSVRGDRAGHRFCLVLRNWMSCRNWRRVGRKPPQTFSRQSSPVFQELQGLLLWLVTLWAAMSSLNMCGMWHLWTTRWFPCIAILQMHKVSYFLCAGLPF